MTNVIAFPKLGLQFSINRVAFTLFGKDIYWYGIIIAAGFVLACIYTVWRAKKVGVRMDTILDIVLWGLPSAIICARLYYVLGDIDCLGGEIWRIIAVWEGGIAIYGAIIGASIAAFIYCRAKRLNTGLIFDLCAPALMIGQIIGRWGNFVNAEVFGRQTDLIWGMQINGAEPVHPLYLYESIWMLVGLIVLLIYQNHKRRDGEVFWLYFLWYGLGRVWMEGLRQDTFILKLGGIALSQVTALLAVILSVGMLVWLYTAKKPIGPEMARRQ